MDPVRKARLAAASSAFLRLRPWIVAPVALLAAAILHASPGVPEAQRHALTAGVSVMVTFFAVEAWRARTVSVSASWLLASMLVTQVGVALAGVMSGGALAPLLLAPTVVGVAAFGRSRASAVLVVIAGALLALMAALPPGVPFPPLPIATARALTLASAAAAIALATLGATALGDAYAGARAESERAKEAALEEAASRGRALATLGAQVAHEIKNPLAAVQGLVELLAEDAAEDARARKRLAIIAGEVTRIEGIVTDYLAYARPLGDFAPRRVDLAEILREGAALVEARARRARATVAVDAPDPTFAPVDPRRLKEALLNLLLNAVEAAPARVRLSVRVTARAAVITVEDDGRGMTAADLAAIGRPFFTTREGGTGLGVVLARQVAERHGGTLAFESEASRGTRAIMTLPIEEGITVKPCVLIVDDEPAVRFTLAEALEGRGFETIEAASGDEALARLDEAHVVVTDLAMPGMDGLALLAAIRAREPDLPVILLTAHGSERAAVQAMKAGAYDYLTKPFHVDEVRLAVARAAEARRLRRSARDLRLERLLGRPIVGESPAFVRVLEAAHRVGAKDVTVLVRGETGTGKELVAELLHAASPRRDGPLVRFNCAAVPEGVAEAELFGHARGAFTGATAARRGLFAEAHRGTLVLDEVGELSPAIQAKLLRALQAGEIQPVGGAPARVDVRVIACTHRDLRALAQRGAFREDIYYRLSVVELLLPPLRERRDDIPLLAEAFARRHGARFGVHARLSPGLLAALAARDWPGNVRELENAVARMLALSDDGALDTAALSALGDAPALAEPSGLRDQVAAFERALIARVLEECDGNQSEAARRLRVTRVTLLDKLKRHGLR
ncbi:MAG: sigma 54-interacting transcriptional regulator [Minicystis sp.]